MSECKELSCQLSDAGIDINDDVNWAISNDKESVEEFAENVKLLNEYIHKD